MTELCLSTSPIKVLSSDGVQFQLTREALPVSQVLYSMIPLDADVDGK